MFWRWYTMNLPFTIIPCSVISTINTSASEILTDVCIAVTFTFLTIWETIVAWVTLPADPLVHIRNTQTLASLNITEIISRSNSMAVASCKFHKKIRAWKGFQISAINENNDQKICPMRSKDTIESEQGLTYTPGQCQHLRKANFLHQTFM